jgi:hypothetical protein
VAEPVDLLGSSPTLFNEVEFTMELRKEENSEISSLTMLLEIRFDGYEVWLVPQDAANTAVCCPRSTFDDPFSTSVIIYSD